jgi:hypothetical protein
MDQSTEIKARLVAYLDGKSSFDEFQVWFAGVHRTARRYDEPTQELIWGVSFAIASYAAHRQSAALTKHCLRQLCGGHRSYIEYEDVTVSSASLNLRPAAVAGKYAEIGCAVGS